MPKYVVKNVKTFRGLEGQGFNCTLYRDGKRVAVVDDSAQGGCLDWHWLDYNKPRSKTTLINHDGNEFERNCTPEEKLFVEHVRANSEETFEPEDMFIHGLVYKFLEEKQYKGWCRKKTVFRLKGDKEGEWHTLNSPYSAKAKEWLKNKYGDAIDEFLNERFVEAVVTT